jgi:peptidoglycan/LPS O-acetylase OafA/YrhL
MFLSGLLFFLKDWQRIVDAPAYFRFVRRRATRLLPGYFVIGFGVVFAKLLAAPFLQVDNPPGELLSALADVVFRPFQSASRGVWFIETLLLMTILAMPFLALFGNRLALALAAAVVIHFIPAPQFLALSQLTSFAIFFLLGAVAADNYDRLLELAEKNGVFLLGGFLAFSFLVMAMLPPSLHQLLIGVAASPVCLALAAGRNPLAGRDWTLYLGRWSYSIYLFNTLAIGLAKALLLKVFPWTSATIPFFAVVLTAVGVLVPCLLGSLVLRRFSVTRNLT